MEMKHLRFFICISTQQRYPVKSS